MRYHVLATDYDGTLAHDGRVNTPTLAALERFLASGRKLMLVTGRELDELLEIFPEIGLFALVVAENGALIYEPATAKLTTLAEAPSADFVRALKDRGVAPLAVGRVIVATWRPHEVGVLATIRDLGLEQQVIFNKDAVMVLPPGVNKASGLTAALAAMNLTPHEAVGVGDAENDHAFLSLCECSAAVANALPAVKERADVVTNGDHGAGVTELIDRIIVDDLAAVADRLTRHDVIVGKRPDGSTVRIGPYGSNLVIAGPAAQSGPAAEQFLARLAAGGYQFCLIDPRGAFANLTGAVAVGTPRAGPTLDEVMELMESPKNNVIVNLSGVLADQVPRFVRELWPRLQLSRARTGRPHWVAVNEAHDVPAAPVALGRLLRISAEPQRIAVDQLRTVTNVLATGPSAVETIRGAYAALGEDAPTVIPDAGDGQALFWSLVRGSGETVSIAK